MRLWACYTRRRLLRWHEGGLGTKLQVILGTAASGGWNELQSLSGCCRGQTGGGAWRPGPGACRAEIKEHFLGEEEEEAVLGKEVIQSHLPPALPESTSPHQAVADRRSLPPVPPAGSGLGSSGGSEGLPGGLTPAAPAPRPAHRPFPEGPDSRAEYRRLRCWHGTCFLTSHRLLRVQPQCFPLAQHLAHV